MMHPCTELRFISRDRGFGVFATAFIPLGTITFVQDKLDISIEEMQFDLLDPSFKALVSRFAFIDRSGNRVLCWDHAKYVNHCCDPNTISTGYGFEIAIRDIHADEQVTDEYGLFNLPNAMDLDCDRLDCRKRISREDLDKHYRKWDAWIIESFRHVDKVPQVLLPYLDGETRDRLYSFIAGKSDYVSVLETQYPRKEVCYE